MDRVRNFLDGLKIEDPKHQLSKSPMAPPSHWNPQKYPPMLVTDPTLDAPSSPTLSPPWLPLFRLTDTQLEKEPSHSGFDSSSSAPSRASSIAYSTCFSSGGRSTSTRSSLCSARAYHSSPERRDGSSDDVTTVPYQLPLLPYDQEPLYEEYFKSGDRAVLVKAINGKRAFLDQKQMKSEKGQWIEHDLEMERRHIRKIKAEKKQKSRPHPQEAIHFGKRCRPHSPCPQASSGIEHASMQELGEESENMEDTILSPRAINTGSSLCISTRSKPTSPIGNRTEYSSMTTRSKKDSQSDSGSSEDATDWEDESNVDASSEVMQCGIPSLLEGNLGNEPPLFQTDLSPIKSRLIDRLMLDFWAIFDRSWPQGIQQHGSSIQSTSSGTTSESGASHDFSSVRYGKHGRSVEENDESDDHQERRRKRAPEDRLPHVRRDDSLIKQFACPFRKHDPRKYNLQERPRCVLKPHKTIARLKAHLYQYHLIEQCPRCKSVFESEETLEAHNMGQERCEAKVDGVVDGMTRRMKDQIHCRRKLHPGQTDVEKWEQIYKILFFNEPVPNPYFEPVSDYDMERPQSPDSVNLAQYEAYLRQTLPTFVQNALETAVDNELQPIEIQLQRRMIDIIREAQNKAFMSFRSNRKSESGARTPDEVQMNIAALSNRHQHTSIETFFRPPPPVNTTSFSSSADLRILQRDTGINEFSDPSYSSCPSLSTTSEYTLSGVLDSDAMLFSSNFDRVRTTSAAPATLSTLDVQQPSNIDRIDDATVSNFLGSPQSPPNLGYTVPNELDAPKVAEYSSILCDDQHIQTTKNRPLKDLWCLDPDLMELNDFEWDKDQEI
ncbi:hypothetical protein BGZ60DRAFT_528116 [Tricladium varicosporioides]|nr:hypothetical protein BGZ60DRAFT_528116 [Hymenoscyphus varicosporioides]